MTIGSPLDSAKVFMDARLLSVSAKYSIHNAKNSLLFKMLQTAIVGFG